MREQHLDAAGAAAPHQDTGAGLCHRLQIGRGAPGVNLALDLVHYVMDGMAVNFLTHDLGEHERRMIRYLEDRLRELSQRAPALA